MRPPGPYCSEPAMADVLNSDCILTISPTQCMGTRAGRCRSRMVGPAPLGLILCARADLWTYIFMAGFNSSMALVFIAYRWPEHRRRFYMAIKDPNQTKNTIFIMYALFVVGMLVSTWTLGDFVNVVRATDGAAYFSLWSVPYLTSMSIFLSSICIQYLRLFEITRSSSVVVARSELERLLVLWACISPLTACAIMIINIHGGYLIYRVYTIQLLCETTMSVVLLIAAEISIGKRPHLDNNSQVQSSLFRMALT